MIISLDRNALKSLIDSDPKFELDLKAAVLSEIVRRFFEKDAAKIIAATHPILYAETVKAMQTDHEIETFISKALQQKIVTRDNSYYTKFQTTPEIKAGIDAVIKDRMEEVIRQASAKISEAFQGAIAVEIEKKLTMDDIEGKIDARIEMITNREINRRVEEKVTQKIAALNEALKG